MTDRVFFACRLCKNETKFTALTFSESKTFKTREGARKWLRERRAYRRLRMSDNWHSWRDSYDSWKLETPPEHEPPEREMVEMPLSDANDLDAVVHALGIEDSHTTPAEAVKALHEQQHNMAADMEAARSWVRKLAAAGKIDLADAPDWLIPLFAGEESE